MDCLKEIPLSIKLIGGFALWLALLVVVIEITRVNRGGKL
jgi:hypothetical protein